MATSVNMVPFADSVDAYAYAIDRPHHGVRVLSYWSYVATYIIAHLDTYCPSRTSQNMIV